MIKKLKYIIMALVRHKTNSKNICSQKTFTMMDEYLSKRVEVDAYFARKGK